MRKLALRLVLLMVFIAGLIILPSGIAEKKVSADPDCPWCDQAYTECTAGCPGPGQPGHFSCIGQCNLDWKSCEADCYCEVCGISSKQKPKKVQ